METIRQVHGKELRLVTSFWDAAESSPGYEDPITRFRKLIQFSQEPAICRKVCRVPHRMWVGGTASNLRRLAHSLLNAVLTECALVGQYPRTPSLSVSTGPVLRERCIGAGRMAFDCYFLPVSTCFKAQGVEVAAEVSSNDISTNLDRVATMTGLRSEVLVMGTLLAWIMRPQHELAQALKFYGHVLGLDVPGARFRRIGMHIRKGDKHSLYPKHLKNHTFRISVHSFNAWARRIAADLGAERVLFLTDDRRATETLMQNATFYQLAPAPAACMPSYNAGILGKAYVRSAIALKTLHGQAFAAAEAARANASHQCGAAIFRDDGIQLFAGMLLLAQCGTFIGTQISNIDAVIVELMGVLRHPPAYFDMLNDVHRSHVSDEKVWYGAMHTYTRPLSFERLANDDGSWTRSRWV